MIKIKVEEIQEFLKISSCIKTHTLVPELSYVRILKTGDDWGIIKTNLAIYCNKKITIEITGDVIQTDWLIEENKLSEFMNKTTSNEATILYEKNKNNIIDKIIISDGKYHLNHSWLDPSGFPQTLNLPEQNGLVVSKEIIDTIRIARAYTSNDENATNFRCVHIKGNSIYGLSGGLLYFKEFNYKFPTTTLLNTYCDVITRFNSARFYTNNDDNYYYYKFEGGIFFAFIQSSDAIPDITAAVNLVKGLPPENFVVSKKDISDFIDFSNSITPSKQVIVSFKEDEVLGSILSLQDNDYSTGLKKEIKIGGLISKFSFNSRTNVNSFKVLPQEEFRCHVAKHTLIIRDKNSYACISGVQDE